MMGKRLLTLMLALIVVLAGCVQTKSDVSGEKEKGDTKGGGNNGKVTIELLGTSSGEADMNIVRDQLIKNGFDVKLNIQPDYGSFKAQRDAGNFDIALSSWTTVTGNPDYAVRSLFKSGGDNSDISDEEVDKLIEKASTETPDEYQETYKQLEQRLVVEKAYIAPLYNSFKAQGVNKDVLNPKTVRLAKSRAIAWETIDFNDSSKRETLALIAQQAIGSLTSLDPIKGNDGSINTLNTNMYVRLVNLTDDDQVISDGSLSYNYAIGEGNNDYYFILRDDINFAKVEDGKAVDTGERVGSDDVVFSLNRAKDKNSVPDHRTYSLHESIKDIEVVTDLSELENVKLSGGEGSIREALEKGLDANITELVGDKTAADSHAGKYQVIKVTTNEPFPQVLNYLAHQSAGIVSKKQVESINTYDVANFNIDKDIPYGDQRTVTEGSTYNNHLYASGPYILVKKNDYQADFAKNPVYRAGSEFEPNISNVTVRFIQDADSALSALRNGEIHFFNGVPETKYDLVENDDKLVLQKNDSNAVAYLVFNAGDRDVAKSENLRKAVLYSINQDEFLNYYQGNKKKAYSTVSPLVNTGNELVADPAKVKEFLAEFQAE
ncbi:ABC transporter substrate-binding protein [Sporosarcina thermotolerans]|uniref:ABC transporter substrate-binding protein n=1 Tax=Sporosarcina thermotolerans TaxID=633404 RepID=A0AAW9AAE9_9BACL|nr:ABC transporter substrate-binding protein [Sporosarcina thermotolerans]MDW0117169.1 ABC transporter substrate-binding protein [Sporosarcina thermotolerans]WHT47342.1 ABC transporter substrate-binding protein [Sporosarcina thermotolerans]